MKNHEFAALLRPIWMKARFGCDARRCVIVHPTARRRDPACTCHADISQELAVLYTLCLQPRTRKPKEPREEPPLAQAASMKQLALDFQHGGDEPEMRESV